MGLNIPTDVTIDAEDDLDAGLRELLRRHGLPRLLRLLGEVCDDEGREVWRAFQDVARAEAWITRGRYCGYIAEAARRDAIGEGRS